MRSGRKAGGTTSVLKIRRLVKAQPARDHKVFWDMLFSGLITRLRWALMSNDYSEILASARLVVREYDAETEWLRIQQGFPPKARNRKRKQR